MKIKILFLFIVLFVNYNTKAQYPYFNNRYESGSNAWSGVLSIVETGEGYLIGGTTGTPPNESWHQITLTILDEKGDKIGEKLYGDTISEYYISSNSLISPENGLITFSGTRRTWYPEFAHDEILLIKLDNENDTLWTKYYGENALPFDSAHIARQLIEISDSSLVIVGTMSPKLDYKDNALLIKVDQSGNLLWEQFYGILNSDYKLRGYSVIETPDKGFAMGAYRFKPYYNETAMPMVYKTDSLGNEEWHINIGGPIFDTKCLLCSAHDGNIMAAFCYADAMSGDDAYRTINVQKIDLDGNVVWDKKYGPSKYDNRLSNIRQTFDGGYIVAGHMFTADMGPGFAWRSGWILKLDSGGDSLWLRYYDNIHDGFYDQNYLYDVVPTTDHGFAACGEVFGPSINYDQQAWAIKVDSMGCDTPGCATGTFVEELSPFGGGQGEVLSVWPNPASNVLNVSSPNFRLAGNKIIRIYNLQGMKAGEIKIPKNTESIEVDVSKYHKGIYYIQYIRSGQIMGAVKFIKN